MSKLFKCTYCKQYLPSEEFYISRVNSRGVSYGCIPCSRTMAAKWNKEHPVRNAESARKFRENHPEVGLAWRKANREHLNKYAREWRHRTGHITRRKTSGDWRVGIATPKWANIFFINEHYDLARMRTKLTGIPWEVDHVIPLKGINVCGLHVETNLRVIPRLLNRRKHNICTENQ